MMADSHFAFLKIRFLNCSAVQKVNEHHHAKFRGDRLNRCWDMVISQFFQTVAIPILDC